MPEHLAEERTAPELDVLAPEPYRKVSGSALKLLAVVSMLVDHTTKRILMRYTSFTTPLFHMGGVDVTWAYVLESFGRLAFPIFCFLLVEGFVHTRDRWKYGRNLLVFALVSEVPFDLSRKLTVWDPSYQNVFFTLFVGYLALCAYEAFRDQPAKCATYVLALALVSMITHIDYGPRGFGLIFALYLLRNNALGYTVMGSCILTSTWRSTLAFIPINLYNGKRGFIQGPVLKYAFYAFYPVHLLVLWRLRLHLFGS